MALWMRLMVNENHIGTLYAQRREPLGSPEPGDVCTYQWNVVHGRRTIRGYDLKHRYGDGALELVRKIIDAAQAAQRLADTPLDEDGARMGGTARG